MMGTQMSTRPPIRELESILDGRDWPKNLTVLHAGCGAMSHVRLPENAYSVGIDVSEKQLERNEDVSAKIVADLVTYDYEPDEYDMVICWNVLEHLNRPDVAMAGFVRTVKPDGLIVLAAPNIRSLKAIVTKFTPHRFHVFVIKHILGNKRAGSDDFGPFPTFLRKSMSPKGMKALAQREGLSPVFYREYDTMLARLRENSRVLYSIYAASSRVLQIVSLGFLGGLNNSDYIIVLKKGAAEVAVR